MKAYLLARLREAATWRGLILIATALGAHLNPDLQTAIITIGLGAAGAVGVAAPDTTKAGQVEKTATAMDTIEKK